MAKSKMESEFMALDKCGEKAEWLRNVSEGIPKWLKSVPTIYIHYNGHKATCIMVSLDTYVVNIIQLDNLFLTKLFLLTM